jgi:hypothetical protein
MPCPICKDETHLASKCPELAEDVHQSTQGPNKETRHDDDDDDGE